MDARRAVQSLADFSRDPERLFHFAGQPFVVLVMDERARRIVRVVIVVVFFKSMVVLRMHVWHDFSVVRVRRVVYSLLDVP